MPNPWDDAPIVKAAPAANPWDNAPIVKAAKPQQAKAPAEPGFIDKALGVGDAALTMGTGLFGAAAGGASTLARMGFGLGDIAINGKNHSQGGQESLEGTFNRVASDNTWQPRTAKGKEYASKVGDFIQDSGIAGLPMGEGMTMGRAGVASKPGIRAASQVGAARIGNAVGDGLIAAKDKVLPKSSMSGVGAAETSESLMRGERAANLPVPMNLTKGMKSRTFEQLKFEKETAKLPEGQPLRERSADLNSKLLQNLDAMDDLTGSQKRALRDVGVSVNDSLVEKQSAYKLRINEAYDKAKQGGQMSEVLSVEPVLDYLKKNSSSMKAAPVLAAVRAEISRLGKGKAQLTLSDVEEVRKLVNRVSSTAPDFTFGGEIKKIIDGVTEGKGGALYQQARRINENYKKEFKDKAVVANLLRVKKGTTDRAVAFEDVYQSTIANGSLDDVRHIRRTLQTSGEKGQQAWRELQGAALRDLKEKATKSVQLDINGNPVASAHEISKFVKDMDSSGKLNFIFGKKGAEQLRDVASIAADIYTSPPGSVNHSNTAAVLFGLLDTAASGIAGLPLPIASAANYAVKKMKSRTISKQVSDALNDGLIPPKP